MGIALWTRRHTHTHMNAHSDIDMRDGLADLFTTWYGFDKLRSSLDRYAATDCKLRDQWDALWFSKLPAVDAGLCARFGDLLLRMEPGDADESFVPQGDIETLAVVLLYDQISRNVFRGRHRAYAFDALAREYARPLLQRFSALPLFAQVTLVLVCVHSETLADHHAAQCMHAELVAAHPHDALITRTLARIVRVHREQVEAFGRLPQRALTKGFAGEQLSAAERAFLSAVMPS